MTSKTLIIVVVNLLIIMSISWATGKIIQQTFEEEKDALELIAQYPSNQQSVILEATLHPEILVHMKNIQKNTEIQFKTLLENLPEDDQKKIFNLSRFPELIESICKGNIAKNETEMNLLVRGYEKELQEDAVFANQTHFKLLININFLYYKSQKSFEDLLSKYPKQTQEAYRELIKLPEILNALTEDMSSTVLIGDLHKNNPLQLKQDLDSLSVIMAEEKTKELNDWKTSLEKDPEAREEYEQASKEFAEEQGLDESNYTTYKQKKHQTDVEIHYIYRPYPYWFGYPWWYSYECWYPYPIWYHRGYYYGPRNLIVFVRFPSLFYMHWHFNNNSNFYHYPHFTNHVVNHYYGHRKTRSSISTYGRIWDQKIKPELPKNWLSDSKNRAERIKEFGKFKMDYQASIQKKNGKVPSQRDYLRNNQKKYPSISPVLTERPSTKYQTKKKDIPSKSFKPPIQKKTVQNPITPIPKKNRPIKKPKPLIQRKNREVKKSTSSYKRKNRPIQKPRPPVQKKSNTSRKSTPKN
jgi:hypothetical protein